MADPAPHVYFEPVGSWHQAQTKLAFVPIEPRYTAGLSLQSLSIHVRDTRGELAVEDRSLEAHYGGFVLTQGLKGKEEARRWATRVRYGPAPRQSTVASHRARVYELGTEPDPDDIDGRPPAVVVWHDGEMLYLIASDQMEAAVLMKIAGSMYP